MGEIMRKELIILLILLSVFLAIGCAGTEKPNETATPAKEATPVTLGNRTGMMDNNTTVKMDNNTTRMMDNNTTRMMDNRKL